MKDIIDLLLQKRDELNADKDRTIAEALVRIDEEFEAAKQVAINEARAKIDGEYADRTNQIDALLATAGYVETVAAEDIVEVLEDDPNLKAEIEEAIALDNDVPLDDEDTPAVVIPTKSVPMGKVVNGRIIF